MSWQDSGTVARNTLIILLLVGLALIAVQLTEVLLLVFGAILLAVLIHSAAIPFRLLRVPEAIAVLLGVAMILGVLGFIGWMFGRQIGAEFDALSARLPGAVEAARNWLAQQPWGASLAQAAPDLQGVAGRAFSFAVGALGAVANLVLVLIAAIYLALQPRVYIAGVRNLFPKRDSERIEAAMVASGRTLQNYLLGQLFTMAFVGTLVGVGLAIVGLPSATALGLIVGLANFVPLIGPILGAIPGILLAFLQSPEVALQVLIVYFVAQQIEGNVLTPIVQRHAVSIPPALLLFALAGLGALFGSVGVILAAPMAVVLYTLVTMLWSRDALGHDVTVPGEPRRSAGSDDAG